jgi:DNA-binding HxlR family transcriptional regulator
MRSYGQYCGLARALDVVGDRWTMLLVRELAIRPSRYRDLRDGLPGIATNLLAERLRQLERDGVVEREEAPPPVGATVYRLTPLGRQLVPVLLDLAAWGASRLKDGRGDDSFRSRWLVLTVPALLTDVAPQSPDLRIRLDVGDEAVIVGILGGSLSVTVAGPSERADVVVRTTPETVVALLTGQVTPKAARKDGLAEFDGPAWTLDAIAELATRALARISVESAEPSVAAEAYSAPRRPAHQTA